MLVELDFLLVGELWVGKEVSLCILPHGRPDNGLSADALVDMEGDRIDFKKTAVVFLLFPRPFEPGLILLNSCFER